MTEAPHGGLAHCPYCEEIHAPRYLCDPAKAFLDGIAAMGKGLTIPDVAFDKPLPGPLDDAAGDRILMQLVVKASMLQLGDVWHPALMISGLDQNRQPTPSWLYPGDAPTIDAIARLVTRQAGTAIRSARQHNRSSRT